MGDSQLDLKLFFLTNDEIPIGDSEFELAFQRKIYIILDFSTGFILTF